MTAQVWTTFTKNRNFFSFTLLEPQDLIKFSPKEQGYELDEDEIVSGMLEPLPDCLPGRPIPEVEPEEFEAIYGFFLS